MHEFTQYEKNHYDKPYLCFIHSETQIKHGGKVVMDTMVHENGLVELDEIDETKVDLPHDYKFYFPHPIPRRTCDLLAYDLLFLIWFILITVQMLNITNLHLWMEVIYKKNRIYSYKHHLWQKTIDNESVYVKPSSFDQYNKYNEFIGEKDAFDEGQEDPIVSLST